LFASAEFIQASRKFACIRIETFESKETERMVRTLLNGTLANTSFCVFDPQGQQQLSRAGRSPKTLVRGRGGSDDAIIAEMNRIASKFKPADVDSDAVLQDFDSFRQALNVASADQRLLLFVTSNKEKMKSNLRTSLASEEFVGRFHLDFADAKTDGKWSEAVSGANAKPGIFLIQPGKFGLSGEIVQQLPDTATSEQIVEALKKCNEDFASVESRKTYREHVMEGRRKGVYFENEIPHGEDIDGDGKVDRRRRGNRGRK